MNVRTRSYAVAGVAALAILGLTACSSDSDSGSGSDSSSASEMTTPSDDMSQEAMTPEVDPAANLVGPGCAAYAEQVPDGAGLARRA